MHYLDQGGPEGPALLLIHGFPFDSSMWEPQISALRDKYRVIAPDLRGHGASSAPEGVYSMELLAEDLRRLLDHLKTKRVILGGLSMGSYIAFAFYRKYAELVRALILADTRPQADTPEGQKAREDLAQLATNEGSRAVAERLLPRLLTEPTREHNNLVVRWVNYMIQNTSIQGLVGALRGMAQRADSTDLLPQISVPTLILVGERDILTPPADAQRMAELIPGARLEIIPEAGHLSNLENPQEFNRILREFLDSLPKP
ncbi:MAG: alpha/beta fold hydrolase [Chloroflexi bacterium]|nr:alpha/beta fold hydrolase [Chloroflexota bacterium]